MKKLLFILIMIMFLSPCIVTAEDIFKNYNVNLESPGFSAFAIPLVNTAVLDQPTRAITCGTDGDLVVLFKDDTTPVTIYSRVAGIDYPYRVKIVYNTTTMTNCTGFY